MWSSTSKTVWAILTKDCFHVGVYKKLSTRKIEPVEITDKINPNAYRLKRSSHIQRISLVLNIQFLMLVIRHLTRMQLAIQGQILSTLGDYVMQDVFLARWDHPKAK